MLSLLLLALGSWATVPLPDGTLRERCDLSEVNHFYDEYGRLVFDQLIFYDWQRCGCDEWRYQVRAWRLVRQESMWPRYDWSSGAYISAWLEDESRLKHRVVIASEFRETWTQYDPELAEREILPKEKRRELRVK